MRSLLPGSGVRSAGALSRTWILVGVSLCYGVYSSLLLCWLPLLGACSRRCGSCRPPEVSFGLRSFWCVRFFLALGCVLLVALSRTWIPAGVSLCYGVYSSLLLCGCRCWAPAPGAAALAGLLRLALVYGRFGVFASSWLWGAFCRWLCTVLGFPLVFRFVMGYTLLCSFAGCRCWAPAPGAAALAGLLRLASVYGRFGVFASSWLWGAFCWWPCPVLGFPLVFRLCYGVYSSLLLCWLPLLGACSRRCGSCRPPEVSFGLRSFWCVRFFLALGCILPVALYRTWIPAGVSLCYGV